jgi:PBSX family phage terminase large subunit
MPFSPKQLEVLRFPYGSKDSLICDGSIRSGKTSILVISFTLWAMSTFNNQQFAICGRTVQATERNIIKPLLGIKYMRDNFQMNYTSSTHTLVVKRGSKLNVFYVFGGNDESSFTLIQGVTLAGVLLDEVALMPRSFVEQAVARCSVPGSKHFFSCNPEGPAHWFYKEWIKNPGDKKTLYLHFTMEDNPSLTKEIKDRYEAMYDGVFYDRYIKGLWVKAEGIIYRRIADNPEAFTYDTVPQLDFIRCGVDFGGNKSAHAFVATGFTRGLQSVVVLESERHEIALDPHQLEELFVAFVNKVYSKYKQSFTTRCDNAEPVLMRGFKNATLGSHTDIMGARKMPIHDRIDAEIKLIGQGRLFAMRWCKTFFEAITNAVWDAKHPDERLDDGTSDIDTLDAFEYSFEENINDLIDAKG